MSAGPHTRSVVLDAALRERAGIAHPRPFVLETTVTGEDLSDVVPHMNNVRVLHWIDRVAEEHSTSVGWGRAALLAAGLVWFVGRHEIDYRAECFEGERLLICTWARCSSGVRSWRDTVIVRPDAATDRPVAVRASTLWVLVELATRRPRRILDEMILPLDPLDRCASPASDLAAAAPANPNGARRCALP